MKIYLASSWRNLYQSHILKLLRAADHVVYDFKDISYKTNFLWTDIDKDYKMWGPRKFLQSLDNSLCERGFNRDWQAMMESDACVLLLPAGRSAHIEAGVFVGWGKPLIIYIPEVVEPELMYKMTTYICTTEEELISVCKEVELCEALKVS